MYFLYSLAIICYAILRAPRLLYDAVRHGKYIGTLGERWGRLPATINPRGVPSIWIHAVSVGEVLATGALIPALRDRYPEHPLWLSTTTQTGRAAATGLDGIDGLFYFPLDLSPVVARVLDRVRPQLFVMVDTELWPNLLRHCTLRGVKTVLVNGRISDRRTRDIASCVRSSDTSWRVSITAARRTRSRDVGWSISARRRPGSP